MRSYPAPLTRRLVRRRLCGTVVHFRPRRSGNSCFTRATSRPGTPVAATRFAQAVRSIIDSWYEADEGTITDRRIVTGRERFTTVVGDRPRARVLLEASTESEWVARHLESLGRRSRCASSRRQTGASAHPSLRVLRASRKTTARRANQQIWTTTCQNPWRAMCSTAYC